MRCCLLLLLLPLLPFLLLLSTCNEAFAPAPLLVESAKACTGAWHMKHHDRHPQAHYVDGKSLILHANGSVVSRNLLRRDLGAVQPEQQPDAPVSAAGRWELSEGGLLLSFPDGFCTRGCLYRKGGYWPGAPELWFRLSPEETLEWVQFWHGEAYVQGIREGM